MNGRASRSRPRASPPCNVYWGHRENCAARGRFSVVAPGLFVSTKRVYWDARVINCQAPRVENLFCFLLEWAIGSEVGRQAPQAELVPIHQPGLGSFLPLV